MTKPIISLRLLLPFLFLIFYSFLLSAQDEIISNDVSGLNPIRVASVISPTTTDEIIAAVKSTSGPISISGSKHSMGGQTATENALQINMRHFNKVLAFSSEKKEITVQTGITWREIQEYIDSFGLSVSIMQSYANFTVGGSLSVNVHGRYIGQGPLILSVKSLKIVLANGDLVTASRDENADIFYGAIGAYGGLGVITECTLILTDNCKMKRESQMMGINDYKKYFFENIRNDSLSVFHNANIYPRRYNKVRAITYRKFSCPQEPHERLIPTDKKYRFRTVTYAFAATRSGQWFRQHINDPLVFRKESILWRNFEASHNTDELEPRSRKRSTYVLQEYFVPVESFDAFYPGLIEILCRHKVKVVNISIRHSNKDPGSTLAWARTEVFAFVLYYKQGTSKNDCEKVKNWTRELVDEVLKYNGTYYLPYQVFATPEQFRAAYPNADKFFALKRKLDPDNKFRNKLWDAYYTY